MSDYGDIPAKNLDLGFDKYNCCDYLMVNSFGDNFCCEKHSENLGSIINKDEYMLVVMLCGHFNRNNNCWIEIKKKNAEKEKQEKIAREKAEIERIIANHAATINNNPNDPQVYERRSFDFVNKGYFDRGIEDYNKAIQLKPDYTEAYQWRGMAYSQKKEYDKAIEDFNHVLKQTPDDADVFSFRGLTYSQKKDYDKAIADFNEAIRLNPKCKAAYTGLGAIYGEKGKLGLSIANYEEALKIEPGDSLTASLLEKAKKRKNEKTKKTVRIIGRVSAVLFVVFSIIMMNVGNYVSLDPNSIGDLIFTAVIFIISFLIIFFSVGGWIIKSISFCAGVSLNIYFLHYKGPHLNDGGAPFFIAMCISYILSCVLSCVIAIISPILKRDK